MKKVSNELVCFKNHNTDISMVIVTEFGLYLKVGCYIGYLTFYKARKRDFFLCFSFGC